MSAPARIDLTVTARGGQGAEGVLMKSQAVVRLGMTLSLNLRAWSFCARR